MKRTRLITLFLVLATFILSSVNAQEIIVVDPGLGTLQAAIDANGGDVVYMLNAGEWYGWEQIL